MLVVLSYLVYLVITLTVTVCVGHSLFRHGRSFLIDAFDDNEALADSVNHLLLVGFYLINTGYVCVVLRSAHPADVAIAIELLSEKLGSVLLVLGAMHFFNIFLFSRFRRSAMLTRGNPPVGFDRMTAASTS